MDGAAVGGLVPPPAGDGGGTGLSAVEQAREVAGEALHDVEQAREALISSVRTARAHKEPLPEHVVEALFRMHHAYSHLADADRDAILETKRAGTFNPPD